MKSTRIKTTQRLISRDDAERLVGEMATLVNRRRTINTEIDDAIIAAKARHEIEVGAIEHGLKEKTALVQGWADSSPDTFAKRKSIEFSHGKVGYRTGTPKVKTLSGWTLARALTKLLSLDWGAAFVAVKQDIAKAEIIAAIGQGRLTAAELRETGLRIDQEESFFIEPTLADTDARITEVAK